MTLRILAVEDSPTQAAALRAELERGGHEVVEARNGQHALSLLDSASVDVLLSDIVMPGDVDGYELCRRVKREHPDLPVILLTSLSDPLDIIRGLEAGADNFLTKPYTPEHLLERIGVLMATRRSRSRGRVQAGITVQFMDRQFIITSEREQILDLLVTTFEDAVRQNHELRRREEEISRAGERLAGMYEIVVALNHCTTEQEILDTALNGAIRLPRIRAAWVSLVEPGGGLRLGAARNLPPSLAAPDAFDGDCRCRRLLRAGDLGSVTNILECERIARAGPGAQAIRYHASVPLHCGGEPLGVMNLLGETDELFDQGGRAVLYGIGSQIGFVIERARMWQRLEERVEERTRALQDSEERYRMLVTEVNDGIFVADKEGVITFANPALARIHGVDSPAELEGRSFAGFLAPEAKAEHLAFFHSFTVEGDAASLLTMPIVRPDGTRAIIEIRPVLVMQAGRVVGSRGVIRDVTERVRADEALQLSDSILRRIGNLVLVADGDGMIKYVSPSVEAGLGYRPDELLGDGWWRLAWEDLEGGERERMKVARLARDASLPNVPPVERAVRARDGSTHWILWQESKGSEGLFIGVGHDITERKKLQEQFLQAQKMEAVGRLAGGIAHDFNNVLTSILITTDLLLPGLSEDTVREDVLAIRVAAKRAAALTRQLLAFSRKQVLKPKVVSLNDLVAGMEDMLRSLLGEDIAIETLLAPGLGNAQIDPSQMEQVIMNLAVNARDAMPRGGRLIMETRSVDLGSEYVQAHPEARPGPHVVLSVTDSGTGMGPETMQLIFEPFFTTKGEGKGTGLGLATVHGIVNQSGGHISVYSEPGRGTTFKVYLPRIEAPADMAQGAEAVQALQGGSETILLVEDDDTVRRAADRVLRRGGYDVLATAGSDEALALLSTLDRRLHLLITDVVMPGLTGPELAERLARAQPGLRVLFVSGYSDEMTARQGLVEHGPHFLEKPFTVDTLLRRVREVLASPVTAEPHRDPPGPGEP